MIIFRSSANSWSSHGIIRSTAGRFTDGRFIRRYSCIPRVTIIRAATDRELPSAGLAKIVEKKIMRIPFLWSSTAVIDLKSYSVGIVVTLQLASYCRVL